MVTDQRTKQELVDEVDALRARVAKLERFEGLYRSIFDAVPLGLAISREDGPVEAANPGLQKILGRTEEQIVGTRMPSYWFHGYDESQSRDIRRAWTVDQPVSYERTLQRADGSAVLVHAMAQVIVDPTTDERWMLRMVRDATEQNLMQAESRAARGQYNAVVESLHEGVCVFRWSKRLVVNQGFLDLLGYASTEEALQDPPLDFLPQGYQDRLALDGAFLTDVGAVPASITGPEGVRVDLEVSFTRTTYDGLPAWVAVLRDVTTREAVQRQLEESERAYRGLFESSPIGIVIEDQSRQILACNPAFAAMTGLSAEEVPQRNLRDFTQVPPAAPPIGGFSRILAGEADVGFAEREWRGKDTAVEWVEVVNSAVRDGDGKFLFAFGMVSDITEQKRAAGLLEASERKYRALFEAAPAGVVILDRDRTILEMNPAFRQMAAIADDQTQGRNTSEFVGCLDTEQAGLATSEWGSRTLFDDLIDGAVDQAHQERQWIAPGSDIEWVEFLNSAVRDADGALLYAISITRDITPRRNAERQRRELFWRLAASAEDERREIARELHDEIGQQLTGLRMQLEIGTPVAVERALEIAEDLMNRVRKVSLDLRPAALDDLGLLPALTSQLERYTERTGVAVTLTPTGVDGRMGNDVEVAVFRIVQEALTNVARHSGATQASVSVALDRDAGVVRVRIADQGRGTTRTLGTTPVGVKSIGLSGMAERAAAVGGELAFESSPGGGAVVEATIPVP
jgi:two-component system sensor histidine kinase UhpB